MPNEMWMGILMELSGERGPLSGLLVLDFGQAAVGPVAAEYLGMLGATVIKVESPRGDVVRARNPTMSGTSTTFLGNNLCKHGVVLDLKSPSGVSDAKRLIALADVLIENFRNSDVMVRLGLAPEVIAEINPRLVYLSSSAYGEGGPLDSMLSNEWISEALSGFSSVTGPAGGPPEFSRATANLDWNGAMANTVSVLAALVHRVREGSAKHIATSQLGSSIFAGITRFAGVLHEDVPRAPEPLGAGHPLVVPDDAYPTADGYIAITAPTSESWVNLCCALDLSHLSSDARFRTNAVRIQNRGELTSLMRERFAEHGTEVWLEKLDGAGVAVGSFPAEGTLLAALAAQSERVGRALIEYVDSPYGEIASQRPQWSFALTRVGIGAGPPLLGEHTDVVLNNLGSKSDLLSALETRSAGPVDPGPEE